MIDIPILLLQAGKDLIVKPARQNAFCSLSKSCQVIHFPDAKHEILMESDIIRNEALTHIMSFFSISRP
jgi:lysophospholipase